MHDTDSAGRRRVCFTLKVDPDRLDEYRARHREVWPDMAAALKASGWHNYSLFLDESGLLIGYLETDDFDAALEAMGRTDVNARWQDSMAEFFDGANADENMRSVPMVFQLEQRLAELKEQAETEEGT